jgi:hypothetical protein
MPNLISVDSIKREGNTMTTPPFDQGNQYRGPQYPQHQPQPFQPQPTPKSKTARRLGLAVAIVATGIVALIAGTGIGMSTGGVSAAPAAQPASYVTATVAGPTTVVTMPGKPGATVTAPAQTPPPGNGLCLINK